MQIIRIWGMVRVKISIRDMMISRSILELNRHNLRQPVELREQHNNKHIKQINNKYDIHIKYLYVIIDTKHQ